MSADVAGYARPPVLNGRIPDVFMEYDDRRKLAIEVENDKSIDRSHAQHQIAAFDRWESRSARNRFRVVVVDGGRGGLS